MCGSSGTCACRAGESSLVPRCPRCRQPLASGQPCRCRTTAPPLLTLGDPLPSRNYWLIPLLAVPLTYGLQLWATSYASYSRFEGAVILGIVLLPLLAQALPTVRARGGGCCLGCMTSFVMMFTLVCLAPKQHDPAWSREEKAILRLDPQRGASVEGVSLGARPGRAGPEVVYRDGRAVWIAGRSLEQNGKVLLSRGDSRLRLTHLFPDYQRHLRTPAGSYTVECRDGVVWTIVLFDAGSATPGGKLIP